MSEPQLSATQRLVRRFVPARLFAEMEAHSRAWRLVCPECSAERSVWEAGGIRYRAASRGKRHPGTCPACGARVWFRVEKRAG